MMPKTNVLILSLLLMIIVGSVFVLTPRYRELQQLREEVKDLEDNLVIQNREIEYLRKEIDALRRKDPKAIERVAREKFGYSRSGEEIYNVDVKYEDDGKSDSTSKSEQ